jgi:hypothetical protein
VAQGVLPENSVTHSRDEFGQMGVKVDELVETLKGNANFAQRIGEGKYDTEFTPASENDQLGMSLINMRNNLIENERRDKERNWIVRGVAEISEILRMHDSTDDLGKMLSNLFSTRSVPFRAHFTWSMKMRMGSRSLKCVPAMRSAAKNT